MTKLLSLAVLSLLTQILSSQAWAIDLYAWEAVKGLPPLVIGVKDNETPRAAAKRYLEAIGANHDLKPLLGDHLDILKGLEFKKIDDLVTPNRVLLLANDPMDYRIDINSRVPAFLRAFAPHKLRSFILPIAHDAGLNANEAAEFRAKAYRMFPFVVGMGGADVDPSLYDEPIKGARDFNTTRDLAESKFIRGFIEAKQGLYIGICRGSQIASAVLGYKMIQDVPTAMGTDIQHADGELHETALLPVQESWLRRLFRSAKTLIINSYHHQAVDLSSLPEGPLVLTAASRDGISEAFQSRDGRILLFQFHPELMDLSETTKATGKKIMDQIIATHLQMQQKVVARNKTCTDLLSSRP